MLGKRLHKSEARRGRTTVAKFNNVYKPFLYIVFEKKRLKFWFYKKTAIFLLRPAILFTVYLWNIGPRAKRKSSHPCFDIFFQFYSVQNPRCNQIKPILIIGYQIWLKCLSSFPSYINNWILNDVMSIRITSWPRKGIWPWLDKLFDLWRGRSLSSFIPFFL